MTDLLDPALKGQRSAIERHHPFPKGYLATLGITSTRDTNQIANYALTEWGDNATIADQPPEEYMPDFRERFSASELSRMYQWHALPENWEHLEYRDLLQKRRELIARVIAQGYQTLVAEPEAEVEAEQLDLSQLVLHGESETVEFKSTLRINLHTGNKDPRMELGVLKTLAEFLNTNGGTLIVGVADDGTPVGVEVDRFPNEDKMSLHLANIVKSRMGPQAMTAMHVHFEDFEDSRVMIVECRKAGGPIFGKDGDIDRFYVRTGPSTTELSASQTQDYIKQSL